MLSLKVIFYWPTYKFNVWFWLLSRSLEKFNVWFWLFGFRLTRFVDGKICQFVISLLLGLTRKVQKEWHPLTCIVDRRLWWVCLANSCTLTIKLLSALRVHLMVTYRVRYAPKKYHVHQHPRAYKTLRQSHLSFVPWLEMAAFNLNN